MGGVAWSLGKCSSLVHGVLVLEEDVWQESEKTEWRGCYGLGAWVSH